MSSPRVPSGDSAVTTASVPRASYEGVELVGSSEAFQSFRALLHQAAQSQATVLLQGEGGTGKGLAAVELHRRSGRSSGPFVVAHLAAHAPTLLEAALFGHERGAFTDAHRSRPGLFRQAEGGTLVLDDIDLLGPELQGKLLRTLQERIVLPLGAEQEVPVDVRLVATTRRDLRSEVAAGRFREDLYYRLAVVTLVLPPLRARVGDLAELATVLAQRVAARLRVGARPLTVDVLTRLAAHGWPGNVRELENALERVFALAPDPSRPVEAAEFDFLNEAGEGMLEALAGEALGQGFTIDELALAMMKRALGEQHGNVSAAARQVGLTRRAFDYRMSRSGPSESEEAGSDSDTPAP